ncbi:MAG: cupin domain-containing protein [Gammaproteobacteria bacterium]|nr:cupin domain-containing protein [Rhodocyclaceae bacterium]MBU3907755.1 cupin domain-containing protein [Gammaproteobacteria bacterium]MBU3989813.1 cupin domain-containing protein [Gammaproteobacteria bacterium]MBU4004401.1 cupin domain-containing protein [Gammaproteobacteria bacterium]MBU4019810.1 cupin domain-containing protein [Gammaproteobacteria bacterium]
MKVRRVTTGHDAQGKAIFVSDEAVNGETLDHLPGAEYHKLWGADRPPAFPDDGVQPQYQGYFPPLGGYRFRMFTVAPQPTASQKPIDRPALLAEMEEKFPGLGAHMEPGNPGMHTTDSIDFEYIVSGEVWLELDDGAAVHLRAGDTVVQNGTRHAWRNRGTEPCRVVVFMLGVPRQPSGLAIARSSA